jgi:hypothetical protein
MSPPTVVTKKSPVAATAAPHGAPTTGTVARTVPGGASPTKTPTVVARAPLVTAIVALPSGPAAVTIPAVDTDATDGLLET